MSSNLTVRDGIYDPTKRFEFTNVTDTDFEFKWGGKSIVIKPGKKVILPHHLAVLATHKMVDQIMTTDINKKTAEEQAKNPFYLAPNKAGSLGVPAARKPYEDKVLRELPPLDDNDSQLGVIRMQFTEQLSNDLTTKASPSVSNLSEVLPNVSSKDLKEFEDINLPSKS